MLEIREIKPVKKQLLDFVHYPIDNLYSDNTCYVPALVTDEVDTLDPAKNPAFDFCESIYYMAYRDGKPVGRIAGIINHVVNKRSGKEEGRFGFIDFEDDEEVSKALIDAVAAWAKGKGCTCLTGPLGFTDMDPEGMLIEGYDQLGTQATIYNHPYYPKHMEKMGFTKDVDWVEFKITVPPEVPEKMQRIANIVKQRYEVENLHYTNRKKMVADYGDAIFGLINEAYDSLFGYSPLSQKQIQHYIKMYLPFLPMNDLSLIAKKDGELIGVGISIPSLSRALIKSRGRLFPTGWYHLLRAFKCKNDIVDLMLVAVKPEYQSKGVNALLFTDLIPSFNKNGNKWAESNPELETNQKVQDQWKYFDIEQHKRRRAFTKEI
ncbi:MAG: N-acetyltransferase [Bacteroidales bacterium]|nr:N-acetyltransferase [Candidatus Sodaliphilus aphodohippi]